jgi:hypothetical protein
MTSTATLPLLQQTSYYKDKSATLAVTRQLLQLTSKCEDQATTPTAPPLLLGQTPF